MSNSFMRGFGFAGLCLILFVAAGCGWSGITKNPQAQPAHSAISTQAPSPSSSPSASNTDPTVASPPSSHELPKEDIITQLISRLTLEQKVGQMILAGIEGKSINETSRKMITELQVGGIILYKDNFSDINGSIKLVNELKLANKGNTAPLFISVDQEGGKVSRLPKDFAAIPSNAKVGRTDDATIAEEMGSLLARELNTMGFNVNFAPVLDINSNPNNPVIGVRSFGNTPELVSKLGIAEMNGLRDGHVIAVVKHFPGHGDTSVDSHLDLPVVHRTTAQLEAFEWLPFRAAIEAEADAIMIAHILFPKIDPEAPASLSPVIINEQLRGTLGYDGVVITDDMTMGAIADHYGVVEASIRSVAAGSDILLIAHGYDTAKSVYDQLLQSVKDGDITESRIDESVYRILTLKHKYNLSDTQVPFPQTIEPLNKDIRQWLTKLK